MGKINYKAIYDKNRKGWFAMTENPGKYEALLAGHYSDNNHFIYELIQNAEDAGASCVVFEYHRDKICFYHDGKPFDENDVIGVSSMLETTKADDAKTIGKFGMGFKSVFKYTCEPEIYSDHEAFRIKNYLLPEEIQTEWDYMYEMKEGLNYFLDGKCYVPFNQSEHLTKVVLPFQKREKSGKIRVIDGSDTILKLKQLEPEILLFLMHIKNLFWIDVDRNKYEKLVLMDQKDKNLKLCQIMGNASGDNAKRYSSHYFYKYSKTVHHPKMGNAEVSLAFRTNSQKKSLQKMENQDVWVYFPTKDKTSLPCILHGSFETAVSREKLMRPSAFNDDLISAAEDLFLDAVLDFKKRGMVTQAFIRQILIPAFTDGIMPDLKRKLTRLFKENALLPSRENQLVVPGDAFIAVPFDLVALSENKLFKDTFDSQKVFIQLNDDKSSGFSEYYSWLKDDLKVPLYSMELWAIWLSFVFSEIDNCADYDTMQDLYDFLDSYRLSDLPKDGKKSHKKSSYEEDVQTFVKRAWVILKKARILINADQNYISAYNASDEEQVYMSSTSAYHRISQSAIVLSYITDNYKQLLEGSFGIKEFDNFEYVRGKILSKYPYHSKEVELTEQFEKGYVDDLLQISKLLSSSYSKDVYDLIAEKCIILASLQDGTSYLMRPAEVYTQKSVEGADLKVYYAEIAPNVAYLMESFYKNKGISIDSIVKLGVNNTPVEDGPQEADGIKAIDEYRPYLNIKFLRKNIEYIQDHERSKLAKQKSASILQLVLENAIKMSGSVWVGSRRNTEFSICKTLRELRQDEWLYCDGELCYLEEITKNELDPEIYKGIDLNRYSEQFKLLGFEMDKIEQTFDEISNFDMNSKQQLLQMLAKDLGVEVTAQFQDKSVVFDPNDFDMGEFPVKNVTNPERLERYIENQFYAADSVQYKEVIIKQRKNASLNKKMQDAYLENMYTNSYGKLICQSCKKIIEGNRSQSIEIANFGIEMEQLHLCLCADCAQKYKSIKSTRKDDYKDNIKRAIEHAPKISRQPYHRIDASDNMPLYFTQLHFIEVQSILQLLDKYGLPISQDTQRELSVDNLNGGRLDEVVVHDGEMIRYQELSNSKTHTVELDVDSYEFHKYMDGRPVGVPFEYKGKQYRIVEKL